MVKVKLQKTLKGIYFVELPADMLRVKKWKEGDVIEVLSGASGAAREEDVVLRKD